MQKLTSVLFPFAVLLLFSSVAGITGYALFIAVDGQWPLRKIITRCTLIFLLLSIVPLQRWLKLSAADLGFAPLKLFRKQLLQGLSLGLLTLLPVLMVLYALDVYKVDPHRTWGLVKTLQTLSISLLLALLISLAEEPLFRGVLLAGLRHKIGIWAAVFVSSVYYASLHFLHSKMQVNLVEAHWYSGFPLLADAFANLFQASVFPPWTSLFMVGMFLALLRIRIPRGLGLCIGCHAAWVWQIKMTKAIFDPNPASDFAYLVSSYDGVIGAMVSGWMLLVVTGYCSYGKFIANSNNATR